MEKIDELDPRHDTYWLLVHNYQAGPAPLKQNEVVCDESGIPPAGKSCGVAPIFDTVRLAVTQVDYDDDTTDVKAPSAVQPREEVPLAYSWQLANAKEGDIYHGVVTFGTSPQLADNIGTTKVDLVRGKDDVSIASPMVEADTIISVVSVAANMTSTTQAYRFEVTYPQGVIISSVSAKDVASLKDIKIAGSKLTFNYDQPAGSDDTDLTIAANYQNVVGLVNSSPTVTSWKNAQATGVVIQASAEQQFVGRPLFAVTPSNANLNAGEKATFDVKVVDAVVTNPQISYQWTQTAGPSATFTTSPNGSLILTAPKLYTDSQLVFTFVGSNGEKQSLETQVKVQVLRSETGGAFSLWGSLLILLLAARRNFRWA